MIALVTTQALTVHALALGWVVVGSGAAVHLSRRGHAPATAAAALLAWPFLLPLLTADAPAPGTGPKAARIDAVVAGLAQALRGPDPQDDDAAAPEEQAELAALAEALHRADARLAWVAPLLQGEDPASPGAVASRDALRQARDRTAAAIDEVLDELSRLRMQAGLRVLSGARAPGLDLLGDLRARLDAAEEVAGVGGSTAVHRIGGPVP